jgi:hypothetical protein
VRLTLEGSVCYNDAEFAVELHFQILRPQTIVPCQVCYARILDSKRKFQEAALRYYELSQWEKTTMAGK